MGDSSLPPYFLHSLQHHFSLCGTEAANVATTAAVISASAGVARLRREGETRHGGRTRMGTVLGPLDCFSTLAILRPERGLRWRKGEAPQDPGSNASGAPGTGHESHTPQRCPLVGPYG